MQGKIIKGIGGFYYVHDGIGKVYECRAKGIFRNRGIKPLVGDDVEISVLDEEKATGNLDEILPRKNRLIRPAVSNVDQAVVVFAITDPMPNLNLPLPRHDGTAGSSGQHLFQQDRSGRCSRAGEAACDL